MTKFEKELKDWFDDRGYSELKKLGFAGTLKFYYMGIKEEDRGDPSEIAEALGLSNQEWNTWEDIWYKKDSWFNQ